MAALGQCRALSGCKAFTGVRPIQRAVIANGAKATMKRNESFMVEVQVGEEEPEDVAVRRYMKLVMQSRVVEKLRARRTKETPLQKYKRETKERHELRKSGFVEPTWEELYGDDNEPHPFDEFFKGGMEDLDDSLMSQDPTSLMGYATEEIFMDTNYDSGSTWGSYVDSQRGGYMNQGGYMAPASGNYANQNYNAGPFQGGSYMQ